MSVTRIPAGSNLQSAIDQAKPGDTLALEAGSTFLGNFVLPKANADWVTITSDVESIPFRPADNAGLAKIISPNSAPALSTQPAASRYRLRGLDMGVDAAAPLNNDLIRLGDGSSAQSSLDSVPSDFVLDACYIHGHPTCNAKRGIALNAKTVRIVGCRISEIHYAGADSQAICGWNGPGDFIIEDNYLEAAGENLMFGGAGPFIPSLVPTGIKIRFNHFNKPLSWRVGDPSYAGREWTVKNLLEIKNGCRVDIRENLLTNCWAHAQVGTGILLSPRNDDGVATWTKVSQITVENNVVRGAAQGMRISGHGDAPPTQQTEEVTVRGNLFADISAAWGNAGWGLVFIGGSIGVIVDKNTSLSDTALIMASGAPPSTGFVFTNNAGLHGTYGVKGDSAGIGLDALAKYFPGATFQGNAIAGGKAKNYPAGNTFPANLEQLAADVGADLAALQKIEQAAINGTSGTPAPGPVDVIEAAFAKATATMEGVFKELREAVSR